MSNEGYSIMIHSCNSSTPKMGKELYSYIVHNECPDLVFSEWQEGGERDCEVIAHFFSLIHSFRPVLLALFLSKHVGKEKWFAGRDTQVNTGLSLYTEKKHPTFPSSTHLVNIAIVVTLCSQTMRQRSPKVSRTGPEMKIQTKNSVYISNEL